MTKIIFAILVFAIATPTFAGDSREKQQRKERRKFTKKVKATIKKDKSIYASRQKFSQ